MAVFLTADFPVSVLAESRFPLRRNRGFHHNGITGTFPPEYSSRRQLKREAHVKALKNGKVDYPKHRSNGNGLKKNMSHKQPIEFQVVSHHHLKFCKRIPLTEELRKLLGRGIMKIIPKEVRERPKNIPWITVYRDTKNNKLVLSVDSVEHQDNIVQDENGNAAFQPDTDYARRRYKSYISAQKINDALE